MNLIYSFFVQNIKVYIMQIILPIHFFMLDTTFRRMAYSVDIVLLILTYKCMY